jgi:hypothetical protein
LQETAKNSDERVRAAGIRFSANRTEYRIEKSHNFIVLLFDLNFCILEKAIRGTGTVEVIFFLATQTNVDPRFAFVNR